MSETVDPQFRVPVQNNTIDLYASGESGAVELLRSFDVWEFINDELDDLRVFRLARSYKHIVGGRERLDW